MLLCISTAIASIPTGLPTFVQAMLSSGARRLVEAKAVVKSLSDVETLGGTTVINSDKTGTLTLNAMTATTMLAGGDWYKVEGPGYKKSGAILGAGGGDTPDFRRLAMGLALCTDATVADDESVIGDPTEAAFVVLAAKMGVDAAQTRESLPRRAEVPFDSEYKFMATFHDLPDQLVAGILQQPHFMSVKGAPDVIVDRCAYALWHGEQVPIGTVRDEILAGNRKLSERGLRVLAFAARDLDDAAMSAAMADPMAAVTDLVLVAIVGIMDPLRTEAKDAVHVALGRRDRRADDHRRPHRDRAGHRRRARARAGRDHRHRTAAPGRRRGARTAAAACTCSGGWHPRTNCGWPGSCRSPARSSR